MLSCLYEDDYSDRPFEDIIAPDDCNRKNKLKNFRKVCKQSGTIHYLYSSSIVASTKSGWPRIMCNDDVVVEGIPHEQETELFPCTMYATGVDAAISHGDFVSPYTVVPLESSMHVAVYYDDSMGTLDIANYVAYAISLDKKRIVISLDIRYKQPNAIVLDVAQFAHRVVPPSPVVFSSLESRKEQDHNESEFVRVFPSLKAIGQTGVAIRVGEDVKVVMVTEMTSQAVPVGVMSEPGSLGQQVGRWVYSDYELFSITFFINSFQVESLSPTVWSAAIASTLLKGRYVVSPIRMGDRISGKSKLYDITALESCHSGNTWLCDHERALKTFENRARGQDVLYGGLADYKEAYSVPPDIDEEKCRKLNRECLPCGVCPSPGACFKNSVFSEKLRIIRNFNYGVVGICPKLEIPLNREVVYYTSPSYGVVFVKYRSLVVLPQLIRKLAGSGSLCGCNFREQCEQCPIESVVPMNIMYSPLKGQMGFDLSDNYFIYYDHGKKYLMSRFPDVSATPSAFDYLPNKPAIKDNVRMREAYKSSAHTLGIIVSSLRAVKWDVQRVDGDHAMFLYYGLINMFRNSPKREHSDHLWYVIQTYYGRSFPFVIINHGKAIDQFKTLFNRIAPFMDPLKGYTPMDLDALQKILSS